MLPPQKLVQNNCGLRVFLRITSSKPLFLLILFNPKNFKINDDYKFYLFCAIIFLSYLVGATNNIPINIITAIRTFEYIIFVIFFSDSAILLAIKKSLSE